MKKIYLASLFFICFFNQAVNAQSCWAAMGSGITNNGVSVVYSSTTYNGLIVGGWFSDANGVAVNNIASYNAATATFSPLGTGIDIHYAPNLSGGIFALAVYNGDLYAGGQFVSAGGTPVNNIARWDGTQWTALGSGILTTQDNNTPVLALAVYNGALYAAGYFDTAGGVVAHGIAKWNGTSWSAVGGQPDNFFNCLLNYNGKLYAAGDFVPAYWNDTTWTKFADSSISNNVLSMQVYNNNIYISGGFTVAGNSSLNNIARWNDTAWQSVGGGVGQYGNFINSMQLFNSQLIAAGYFSTAGNTPVNSIAAWNGAAWAPLGDGIAGGDSDIATLSVYNGSLYAFGDFSGAGGASAANAAQYTCATTGVDNIITAAAVNIYPNPTGGIINFEMENMPYPSTLNIYNLTGQKIYTNPLATGKNQIDLTTAAKGVYFYRVAATTGQCIATGSLVVQ